MSNLATDAGFDAPWKRRVAAKFGSADTYYISLDDLVAEKRSAGRGQDQADLEALGRSQGEK